MEQHGTFAIPPLVNFAHFRKVKTRRARPAAPSLKFAPDLAFSQSASNAHRP
jgi:hypothetical protein